MRQLIRRGGADLPPLIRPVFSFLRQEPVGLRMIRLQRWQSGSYFADFSLHIPDLRSFLNVREIVKICTRPPTVSLPNN